MSEKRNSRTAVLATAMLLLGALAGLLVATESSGADPSYTRNGFVLADAAPLEGATVTAFNPDTGEFASEVTLADGFYEFDDLTAGHYLFRYSADGYLTQVKAESVFADGMTSLDDTLLIAEAGGDATLDGTVTDADGNVTGATVTLTSLTQKQDSWWATDTVNADNRERVSWITTTNATGYYSFSGLVDEAHNLRVSAPDHYTEAVSGVNANTTEDVVLTKENGDNLQYVYVKDNLGNTIRDADVMMYERATGDWTDADKLGGATYVFRPQAGDYVFFAQYDGFHAGVWSTTIAGPGSHTFNLEVVEPGAASASYTLADWDDLTWSLDETLKYDQGRMADAGDVLLTGVMRFDIDRLWGDDDGTTENAEVADYEDWEAWLGAPFSAADLTVDGEVYTYDADYDVVVGGVSGVGGTAVDDVGDFTRTTDASFTSSTDDDDSYDVGLAVEYGTDRFEYTYSVTWPAGFECIDNSTGNKVTVTGEGESQVNVVTDPGNGGETITLTVASNELPVPVLRVTSDTTFWNETHVIAPDEQVNFSASESTDTYPIVDYDWDFGDGNLANGERVNHTYLSLGLHTVTLTVEDSFGATNQTSVTILVDDSAPDPQIFALIKETIESEGEHYIWNSTTNTSNIDEDFTTVVFNGSNSSDDDTYIVAYAWDFGDNTTDTGSVVSKQYSEPGEYIVRLNVTDAAGNEGTSLPLSLKINDVTRPEVAFSYSYEEDTNGDGEINATSEVFANAAKEGLITTFNATLSQDNYDDTADLTYRWEFGDEAVIEGQGLDFAIVEHVFVTAPEEGFNVHLTVHDRALNEQVAAQNVIPAKADKPDLYVIELNFSKDRVVEDDNVEITAHIGLQGINITTPFHVSFYVDSVSNTPVHNATVDSMTTGLNNTIEVSFTWKAKEGNRNIIVVVDSGNEVEEASEANTHSRTMVVKAGDDGGPDTATLVFIIGVVVVALGVAMYIYRDRFFPKK